MVDARAETALERAHRVLAQPTDMSPPIALDAGQDQPAPGSKAWHRMMDERYFPEEVAERDAADARAAPPRVTRSAGERYASELDFQAFRAGLKDALPRREARFKDDLLAELRPILAELAARVTDLEEVATGPRP